MRVFECTRRVVVLCVSAAYLALRGVADLARRLAGRSPRGRCVALYYHGLPVRSRKDFAWQMDELLSCATPLHASATRLPDSGSLFVLLTFDDGFRSFVESALPELVSRGIPAALFVPAGNLGRPPEWLAGSGHADSDEVVLNEEELRRLPARLVTVGSHTLTHPRLSGLAPGDAWRELAESRGKLQCVLGRPVSLLSLPHGDFDASVLDLARKAHYSRVFTVSPSLADLSDDAFVSGRCPVSPGDWRLEFRLKVRGAYSWLATASAVKRRLLRVFLRRAA